MNPKEVAKVRPDVVSEIRFLATDYLLKQGPLSGLQKELAQEEYISEAYILEKIDAVRRAMDAIEHDFRILRDVQKDLDRKKFGEE